MDLAPQLRYQNLPVMPWPDVDGEVYETCRTLADHLDRYRQLHDVTPSVMEEESLLDTVNDLIDQALDRPVEFGLNKAVADDIVESPAVRERIASGTRELASRLFPLLRLLYLKERVE